MKRFRHHANPFCNAPDVKKFDSQAIFGNQNPLILEIGFGLGRFFVAHAQKFTKKNFIGLEIRTAFVELVNAQIKKLGLKNALAIHANANFSLINLFGKNSISEVYILFPDPWVKRKHLKRRLVQADLIKDLYKVCRRGAKIQIKTDEEFMHTDIKNKFATTKARGKKLFKKTRKSKLPHVTTREKKYIKRGKKIWQLTYQK